MLKEGQIVHNRWVVLRPIGEGATATVYLVNDLKLSTNWALKEIKISNTKQGRIILAGVLAEINLLRSLNYEAFPRIVDVVKTDSALYILMDYIDGRSLKDVLEGGENGAVVKIDEDTLISWGISLCKMLRYLHNHNPKIIYRDLKPRNIMLNSRDELKLLDFGASIQLNEKFSFEKTSSTGTLGYAAPEQYIEKGHFDERVDIHALGRTLYHLATGFSPARVKIGADGKKRPIKLPPLESLSPDRSSEFIKIVNKAMAPNPDDRFKSVNEMLFHLENIEKLSGDYQERVINRLKSRFKFVTLACTGLVCGALLTTYGFYHVRKDTEYRYQSLVKRGIATKDLDSLVTASQIKGDDLELLSEMVELINDDGIFSEVEEEKLKTVLENNLAGYQAKDGFGEVAYAIGRAYWFNYSNGVSKAREWFGLALEAGTDKSEQASLLLEIADFTATVKEAQEDLTDEGIYIKHWETLTSLEAKAHDDTSLTLTLVKSTFDLIEGYSVELKDDGVTYDQLLKTFNSRTQLLSDLPTNSTRVSEQVDNLLSRVDSTRVKLDTAFGKRGG